MAARRRRVAIASGVAAAAVLVGLLVVVGAEDVFASLTGADPAFVAAAVALALCWLVAWSLMFRTVLAAMGVDLSVGRAFLLYAGAVFANNVTPFGQAGGEPVTALLVSRTTDARYETGLAGIATVDVCNVVPSVAMAVVGVGYYAITATVGDRLEVAIGTALALVAGLVVAATVGWRGRETIVQWLPATIAGVAGRVAGSRVDSAALEVDLGDRLGRFFENLGLVAADRRRLAVVLGLSLTGWLLQAAVFVAAFAAVGHDLPVAVALFAVPLANLAGAAPLPGGLGGIETAFVALVVPTTGIEVPAVTAAVLVFRGAIYWLPIAIGGSATAVLGTLSAG